MRYIGYGFLIVLLMSGCVRRFRHIPMEPAPIVDQNETEPEATGTLYDTTRTEHKYKLKPEPYSVGSKEKDPELLGPQGTIQKSDKSTEIAAGKPTATPQTPSTTLASTMNKQECISMIGAIKFKRYSKRFGGESGAIKRCAILKKLKKG